jgi:hypothetical protein
MKHAGITELKVYEMPKDRVKRKQTKTNSMV